MSDHKLILEDAYTMTVPANVHGLNSARFSHQSARQSKSKQGKAQDEAKCLRSLEIPDRMAVFATPKILGSLMDCFPLCRSTLR